MMAAYHPPAVERSYLDGQQNYGHRAVTGAQSLPLESYSFPHAPVSQPQPHNDFPGLLDPTMPAPWPYQQPRQYYSHHRNGSTDSALSSPPNHYYMPAVSLPHPTQSYPTTYTELSDPYLYPRRHSPIPSIVPASDSPPVRESRSASFHSTGAFATDVSQATSHSDFSRGGSPSMADLSGFGYLNVDGTWSCAFPGCTSRATFTRGCDLRKHYKRHTKSLFCRHEGCPQATEGGFSSKKDRARHEAKHNPGILCEWGGCERVFSRVDNMKDHVRRIHKKGVR